MLEQLLKSKKVTGVKQCTRAVENDQVRCVFLARDAEERVVRNLKALCEQKGIPVEYVDTMKQLGKACGIQIGAASAGLLK